MPIAALGLRTRGLLLRFEPFEGFGVEYSQLTMIFLTIIAPENVEFFLIQSGSVIFYLWC